MSDPQPPAAAAEQLQRAERIRDRLAHEAQQNVDDLLRALAAGRLQAGRVPAPSGGGTQG